MPQEFKLKNKQGPDRVCYGCRDGCVKRKNEFYLTKGLVEPASKKVLVIDNICHLFPCEWTDPSSVFSCFKCLNPLDSHRHNCRICGDVYCSDCTVKMNIPPQFEKKAKSGPARVCHDCRYKIFGKAVLEQEPLTEARAAVLTKATKPAPPVAVTSSSVASSVATSPVFGSPAGDVVLRIKFAGEAPIANFSMPSEATLAMVHARLSSLITVGNFFYMLRGKPIFPEHYDLFLVKHLEDLTLSRGTIEEWYVTRIPAKLFPSPKQSFSVGTSAAIQSSTVPAVSSVSVAAATSFEAANDVKDALGMLADALIKKATKETAGAAAAETVSKVEEPITEKQKPTSAIKPKPVVVATARTLYDFSAMDHTHLSFSASIIINVLKHDNPQWWFGELNGARGWFPASYVELIK